MVEVAYSSGLKQWQYHWKIKQPFLLDESCIAVFFTEILQNTDY